MDQAVFFFHGELNDLLPRRQRGQPVAHTFDWRASVKDMLESLGPPHAEVELIVVNGQPVDFSYIVADGDEIHVYPQFDAVDLPGRIRLRPPLPRPPRFVLDIHLGRLAAYLRMMGFDCIFGDTANHDVAFDDAALARIAHDEQRVMLSRDTGLLKRSAVVFGCYIRSTQPRIQLAEVIRRYDLAGSSRPFSRCMKCNGLLSPVEKEAVLHLLKPDTARYVEHFHQCQNCGRVYWRGIHTDRMQALIDSVLRDAAPLP
jgi:hypothetical protein